jgi:hypothetical protein
MAIAAPYRCFLPPNSHAVYESSKRPASLTYPYPLTRPSQPPVHRHYTLFKFTNLTFKLFLVIAVTKSDLPVFVFLL